MIWWIYGAIAKIFGNGAVMEHFFIPKYSAFQMDKPHRHNQNPVGAIRESPLQWSTEVKTAVSEFNINSKF